MNSNIINSGVIDDGLAKLGMPVYDVYDDDEISVLRNHYGSIANIPEQLKEARLSSKSELEPDDYALARIDDEGNTQYKYPVATPGDVLMSTEYFLLKHGSLDTATQTEVAIELCNCYDDLEAEPPDRLQKLAGLAKSFVENITGSRARKAQKALDNVSSFRPVKRAILKAKRNRAVANRQITRSIVAAPVAYHYGKKEIDKGKQWNAQRKYRKAVRKAQAAQYSKYGSFNGKAENTISTDTSTHFALGDRYPIETPQQIKKASDYFNRYRDKMEPSDELKFASNVTARAAELSISPGRDIEAAGNSVKTASLKDYVMLRKNLGMPSAELSKLAAYAEVVPPEQAVKVITAFDRANGLAEQWGKNVPSPVTTVMGNHTKLGATAEDLINSGVNSAEAPLTVEDELWKGNGWGMSKSDLIKMVSNNPLAINSRFGAQLTAGLVQNPVVIFKSLPDDTKDILAAMAREYKTQVTRGDDK